MSLHMRPPITPDAAKENERVLATIERLGGEYVWDPEVFVVALMNVAVGDDEATTLCRLVGVEQIVLDASCLSYAVLERIAKIRGLCSLVLSAPVVSLAEVNALRKLVPEILVVDSTTPATR